MVVGSETLVLQYSLHTALASNLHIVRLFVFFFGATRAWL